MSATSLILTCEHGGNAVPARYRALFRRRRRLLHSHRGLDLGARFAARALGESLGAPLVCASVTRLLVDLNRSEGHRQLFSELTRPLAPADREEILRRYYHPYRDLVTAWIAARLARGDQVLHVSVHSFTPARNGERRRADVGLLYDPGRPREARFCAAWQAALAERGPGWQVRRNYPYRGTSDGFVVSLRRQFGATRYAGIEVEINQALLARPERRRPLLADLAGSLPA